MKPIFLSALIFSCFFATSSFCQNESASCKTYTSLKKALRHSDEVYCLDLSNKRLKFIPEQISQLRNLKILNLNHNEIADFPPFFWDLIQLEELYLDDNKLDDIPEGIGRFLALRKLKLSRNRLTSVSIRLVDLVHLEILDVSFNDLGENDLAFIKSALPKCLILTYTNY